MLNSLVRRGKCFLSWIIFVEHIGFHAQVHCPQVAFLQDMVLKIRFDLKKLRHWYLLFCSYKFSSTGHPLEESSQWVGAWWLGFLAGGCIAIVFSFPILLLPKILPGTAHVRLGREGEIHQHSSTQSEDQKQLFGFKYVATLFVLMHL